MFGCGGVGSVWDFLGSVLLRWVGLPDSLFWRLFRWVWVLGCVWRWFWLVTSCLVLLSLGFRLRLAGGLGLVWGLFVIGVVVLMVWVAWWLL